MCPTATNHLREATSLRKNTSSPSKSPSLVGYGLMGLLQNFKAILMCILIINLKVEAEKPATQK
jgi:hypothetical protein